MTVTAEAAGRVLAQALALQGVRRVFCVPGESFLPLLDGLYTLRDQIELIVCRHEAGASHMAEAHGKLTGSPGVCVVTRGPGASHAAIGLHTAFQDSSPMVMLIGQVGSDFVEREAFQEVDYRRMFGPMAKWVAQIDRADRIDEFVSHAFHLAVSGRPGPVVLALPEDMLSSESRQEHPRPMQGYQRVASSPAPSQIQALSARIQSGQRPLMVLGGGGWNAQACDDIAGFAESFGIALASSFRCQDLIRNDHPCYVGHLGIGPHKALAQAVEQADPLIVIGARLGEMTTSGYSLVSAPRSAQTLVHIHAGAEELGRVYAADLLINSGMPEFAQALLHMNLTRKAQWQQWTDTLHRRFLDDTTAPVSSHGQGVDLAVIVSQLQQIVGRNAIVTNGAGNYAGWLHRYWRYEGYRSQLAPTSGAMGYGLPAAIAAKLEAPERAVVCFAGDGCFLMSGQELATAVQYKVAVLIIVCNNGMYGTIRMHQERHYPNRVWGTDLQNPDFAALAQAYGAFGEKVSSTAEFLPALSAALASKKPALLELITDSEKITSRASLSDIRPRA